jgi:DNA-binding PadR family transcriptional regulator
MTFSSYCSIKVDAKKQVNSIQGALNRHKQEFIMRNNKIEVINTLQAIATGSKTPSYYRLRQMVENGFATSVVKKDGSQGRPSLDYSLTTKGKNYLAAEDLVSKDKVTIVNVLNAIKSENKPSYYRLRQMAARGYVKPVVEKQEKRGRPTINYALTQMGETFISLVSE